MREAMTVIYYPDGTRVGPLIGTASSTAMRGCEPGEPPAGPLNPVLWPR